MSSTLRHRPFPLISVVALLVAGCGVAPESSFELSPSSRLPQFMSLPAGLSRRDVSVTLNYFVTPARRTATFTLFDARKHLLATVTGTLRGMAPLMLRNAPPGFSPGYPTYEVISANGTTDVVEHRRLEPVFYLVDDPAIRSELGLPANYRLERP